MNFNDSEVAQLTNFVQTELQHNEASIYKIRYPDLVANSLVPMFSAPVGSQTIAYDVNDFAGEAELITNYGKDVPAATTGRTRKFRAIYSYGMKASYTMQEVESAQMARLPIEVRQLEAARRGVEIRKNKTILFSDPAIQSDNFYGLFNCSEVGCMVNGKKSMPAVKNPTNSNAATWQDALNAATTDDEKMTVANQIKDQINFVFARINTQTLGVEVADTLLLPRAQFNLLYTTVISKFTQQTLLSWIISNSPYLKGEEDIEAVNELSLGVAKLAAGSTTPFTGDGRVFYEDGAAVTSADLAKDCMFIYHKNPEKLKQWIARPFSFLAPQLQNFQFNVSGFMSTGGTIIYYPLCMAQVFGI